MKITNIFKETKRKDQKGFTLIELLVVIAIIGLLASVVMMSLGLARAKARDVKRRADLKQIMTAMELYYSDYNTFQVSGGGYFGGGQGWFSYEDGSAYVTSVAHRLNILGYLGNTKAEDPMQNPGYMIYLCNNGQSYAVSATLEYPTANDIAFIQTTCNGVGGNGTYTVYGKNFAVGHN
ncbi:MAG: type II secretion system protein [Patescibacteria group bacterium]